MRVFNNLTKIFISPIYYIFHYNIIFGFLHKYFIGDFKYKNFKFNLKDINFPLPFYSSFIFNTYELNDRILIERNLTKNNKCIIIGGGIGFIGVISFHISKNNIILFEINNEIINTLKKNLKFNNTKFKVYNGNLLLNDKGKKKYYYKSNNFLANSYYRKNGFKIRFKNIHYKKIKNLNKFNTLIIDGEGVEEHYINNLNRMPNIKYLFFEFHNDIFTEKIKINFFKKLKLKGFKLKDSFMNSYFFTKELVK